MNVYKCPEDDVLIYHRSSSNILMRVARLYRYTASSSSMRLFLLKRQDILVVQLPCCEKRSWCALVQGTCLVALRKSPRRAELPLCYSFSSFIFELMYSTSLVRACSSSSISGHFLALEFHRLQWCLVFATGALRSFTEIPLWISFAHMTSLSVC